MTGRELPPTSAFAGDDGSAAPAVEAALTALGAGSGTVADVVAALAGTRVLVPVLAELEVAETVEVGGHAHTVDKEASAGIVALQAPDGRTALPVFSSVATMSAWRRDARPVPTEVVRAALSAVDEGWELLVLDPGGPVTALLPRPAVWALARQQDWRPAVVADPGTGGNVPDGPRTPAVAEDVRSAVRNTVVGALHDVVVATAADASGRPALDRPAPDRPAPDRPGSDRRGPDRPRGWFRRRRPAAPAGEPHGTAGTPTAGTAPVLVDVDAVPGSRAEVAVVLSLVPGLDRAALDAVLQRVGAALAADEVVTQRVDSVEVRLR